MIGFLGVIGSRGDLRGQRDIVFGESVSHPFLVENVDQNAKAQQLRHCFSPSSLTLSPDRYRSLFMDAKAGPTQPADAAAMPFSSAAGAGDWRTHLHPEARLLITNKIMETLQRHLPISDPVGVNSLTKIAVWLEENVYNAATSQNDYLQKVSLKMLSMDTMSRQSAPINPEIPNAEGMNQNPTYQGPTQPADTVTMGFSSTTTTNNWRTHLQPEARLRVLNKIMETLQRHLPVSSPDGVSALLEIVVRFEEKIYNAATSQNDYLRKISLKMLAMEKRTPQSAPINPAIPNAEAVNQNSTYQGNIYEAVTPNRPNKRLHISANRSIVNCDLEDDSHLKRMKVSEPASSQVVQEEPTFSCPICMCALVSPFTTVCGHIFCEGCIKAATKNQKKCPTCRSKLTGRNNIHRVFLPATYGDDLI